MLFFIFFSTEVQFIIIDPTETISRKVAISFLFFEILWYKANTYWALIFYKLDNILLVETT